MSSNQLPECRDFLQCRIYHFKSMCPDSDVVIVHTYTGIETFTWKAKPFDVSNMSRIGMNDSLTTVF